MKELKANYENKKCRMHEAKLRDEQIQILK